MGLNTILTSVLIRERREGYVKTEAEIGMMQPRAKEHPEPPQARRGKEGFSLRAFRESVLKP